MKNKEYSVEYPKPLRTTTYFYSTSSSSSISQHHSIPPHLISKVVVAEVIGQVDHFKHQLFAIVHLEIGLFHFTFKYVPSSPILVTTS